MVPRDGPPDEDPEEGPVLSPEELDIADDEHVTQIDEGRFVVSPEARPADDTVEMTEPVESAPETDVGPEIGGTLDRPTVHAWLENDLGDTASRYGFDVTARFGENVAQRRMVSNDVITIFESLVLWYAQQIDSDTPVEEVLGILLLESNVPVRYPPRSLQRLVTSSDLGPEDSIADLLAAVEAEDGVEL